MSSLPDRYAARPVREGDLDDVLRMIDASDAAFGVPPDPMREFLTWIWHLPSTDLERDTRVVLDGDTIVALGMAIWRSDQPGPLDLTVRVHPEHVGNGIGAWLASWAEDLGRERGSEGVRAEVVDRDEPGHELLRSRGHRQVRSTFTMWKSLEAGEDPGTAPPGVVIRSYVEAEERVLYEVHEASFADHWGYVPVSFETFNEEMHGEDWDPSLVFLADVDGATVGHVVAFAFGREGFVAVLGVLKPSRSRGIGKVLLRRAFAELASRGCVEVRLGVDAENPHGALGLYEGVGMIVRRRYDLFEFPAEP